MGFKSIASTVVAGGFVILIEVLVDNNFKLNLEEITTLILIIILLSISSGLIYIASFKETNKKKDIEYKNIHVNDELDYADLINIVHLQNQTIKEKTKQINNLYDKIKDK
ncbi:hypothetical protein MBCUT_07000 [Methanobrevibacter cuticularis]|uniref:Uncharacterized protein n=1 Tax=Methanobrevibacter cuticularis TaxID=47311 RepID=A0A166EHK4_9EURY|nr:hypothetical protein MBCUT_07000 [Methanobrevibacter cuticularis]